MKKCSVVLGVLFILLTASFVDAVASPITLVNPGFETGTLDGWSVTGSGASVVLSAGSLGPAEGLYFLKLSSATSITVVSQTFDATAGDALSGRAALGGGVFGLGTVVAISSLGTEYLWFAWTPTSGWQNWTWTAPATDSYTLSYRYDGGTPGTFAAMDAVPIPTTVLLLASGLVSVVVVRRRKSRQA